MTHLMMTHLMMIIGELENLQGQEEDGSGIARLRHYQLGGSF